MFSFQHIPFLNKHLSTIDSIMENWKQYKLSVPTYGAILLSEDLKNVLLVQSFWAKSSWGFPKGKINENEDPAHCAIREVYEETGYDISKLIVPTEFIEQTFNDQYIRLYLVKNVPITTHFAPRTRKEIKCIEWFPVDFLPTSKNDIITKTNLGKNSNSFFMIIPFIKRLKKWISERGRNQSQSTTPMKRINHNNSPMATTNLKNQKRQRHKSMGDIEVATKIVVPIIVASTAVKLSKQQPNTYFPQTNKYDSYIKSIKRQLFDTTTTTQAEATQTSEVLLENRKNSTTKMEKVKGQVKKVEGQKLEAGKKSLESTFNFDNYFIDSWVNFTFDREKILNVF